MVPVLRFIAQALWLIALSAVMLGFIVILINGTWPDAMRPIQRLFQALHGALGSFAWLVQVAIFAGPGTIVWWLADYLEDRQRKNSN